VAESAIYATARGRGDTAGDPQDVLQSGEGLFDHGRARAAVVRLGKKVQFKKGDVGLFPFEEANRLINQAKVCELIEPVYVRSLNDYETGFRGLYQRFVQLDEDLRQAKRDTQEVTQANNITLEQIRHGEDERGKLDEDVKKTTYERDEITKYAAALETKLARVKGELSQLFRRTCSWRRSLLDSTNS